MSIDSKAGYYLLSNEIMVWTFKYLIMQSSDKFLLLLVEEMKALISKNHNQRPLKGKIKVSGL